MKQYALITASYWGFTLTDGALRMLVVLYFHQLGYGPLAIASLFLLYEFFGVVTNLVGGWLGARLGLGATLLLGLGLQILALSMLLVDPVSLTVFWVMSAQALSGIAKDLTKMSAKSGVKTLVPDNQDQKLFRWVATLTGSKNALKGLGYFLGGVLLSGLGFRGAIGVLAGGLTLILLGAWLWLDHSAGQASFKPKFKDLFSKSPEVNTLAAARLFLFGARDVWFVVALPVYLQLEQQWSALQVSTLLAVWVIGYGVVQALTPRLLGFTSSEVPGGRMAVVWGGILALTSALVLTLLVLGAPTWLAVVGGLLLFGAVFAMNSSLHSFLIVRYAEADGVSLDVGFYYMANAMGRLLGTLLSGLVYQLAGFAACLMVTLVAVLIATLMSRRLPTATASAPG